MHIEDRWFQTVTENGRKRKIPRGRKGTGRRWRVRYTDPAGRERSKSFDRQADAEAFAVTTAADVRRGAYIDPDAGKVTLRQFGDGWLAMQTSAASTREATTMRLRRHIYPVLGGYTLAQLAGRPSLIQSWLAGLAVSDSYARVVFTTLSAVLNAAVADELIARNPCQARNVRPPKAASRRIEPWTTEQVAAVRAALPERWRVVCDLGAGLGMRQGEIFGLASDDVEWLRKGGAVVHVRRQVRIVGSRLVFAPPKGGRERTIPLPATMATALSEHLRRYPATAVTLPWLEPGGKPVTAALVLTTPIGHAVNRNSFNTYQWQPALSAAGIPASRENGTHALRHHFASVLLHHGCDIKALSEYLGHASAAFTLAVYTHLMPSAHDRMREAIDAIHHGPATAQEAQG